MTKMDFNEEEEEDNFELDEQDLKLLEETEKQFLTCLTRNSSFCVTETSRRKRSRDESSSPNSPVTFQKVKVKTEK